MIFLSEYSSRYRTAEVYRRNSHNDFVAVGYEHSMPRASHPFLKENQAEDWAEDWVQGTILNDNKNSQN